VLIGGGGRKGGGLYSKNTRIVSSEVTKLGLTIGKDMYATLKTQGTIKGTTAYM
jgi:hypothetical protein